MTTREWIFACLALLCVAWAAASYLWPTEAEQPHQASTLRILKQQEGFNGHCYPDAGGQSVGYGTHLPLTKAEAELLMTHRLGKAEAELADRWNPYRDQPEHIKQALSLMAYQLGVEGELGFTKMLACLERGDTHCAAREALDSQWERQTPDRPKIVAALLERGR